MLNLKNLLNELSEEKINQIVDADIRGGWNKSNGRKCSTKGKPTKKSKKSKKVKIKSIKIKSSKSSKSKKSSKSTKHSQSY